MSAINKRLDTLEALWQDKGEDITLDDLQDWFDSLPEPVRVRLEQEADRVLSAGEYGLN